MRWSRCEGVLQGPLGHPAVLNAFVALDAFRQGHKTAGLFVKLAQLFVLSEIDAGAHSGIFGFRRFPVPFSVGP